jgi:arginine/lysine/ornithine decarboxylase
MILRGECERVIDPVRIAVHAGGIDGYGKTAKSGKTGKTGRS